MTNVPTGGVPTGGSTFGGGVPDNNIIPAVVPALPDSWTSMEMARTFLNTDDDFELMIALQAATAIVRDYLQIDYFQQVTSEIYQVRHSKKILLNRGPINSVSSVSIISTNEQQILATISSDGYFWDEKFLTIQNGGYGYSSSFGNSSGWAYVPNPSNQINYSVTYDAGYVTVPTSGYNTMPQAIQIAVIYTAKAMLMARTADFNVSGENAAGAYSMQYLISSVGGIPPTAMTILQPYKRTAKW